MDTFFQDLRYALRSFRSAPMVTVVAALTIAIGIGATTTIASVANALLLRAPAGVRGTGTLVTAHALSRDGSSFHAFSYLDLRDLQRAAGGLSDLAGYTVLPASVKTGEDPELRLGMLVTGNYFSTLGTRPALGRFFTADEDRGPGGPRVMVLSHAFWQRRFAADSGILGRVVTVNGQPLTVVGVTEAGFHGHTAAMDFSLWVPLVLDSIVSNRQILTNRQNTFLEVVARLGPDTPRERAASALNRAYADAGAGDERLGRDRRLELRAFTAVPGQVFLPVLGFLGLLLVLAALVLLIAGANVANVLLARASARSREMAVRLAVGAGRGRLIRQLVTESLLLFLLGGIGGTLLAVAATRGLGALRPPVPLPVALDFHIDLTVLAAALGITLFTGLVFGLAPALQSTRLDLIRALKDEPGSARIGRFRLRGAFVVAQVAGTALLLVTAGLFTRAMGRAGSIDLGFDPAPVHVLNLELQVGSQSNEQIMAFAERLIERTAVLPGVTQVAATDFLPINLGNQTTVVAVDGRDAQPDVGQFGTDFARVTPGYFHTLTLPLARGREFGAADRAGAPEVAIINETLARRIWPGEDPIGKRFRFGSFSPDAPLTEVVGVARDAKYRGLSDREVSMVYRPLAQDPSRGFSLLLRSAPGAANPAVALKSLLRELDPSIPIAVNSPYAEIIGVSLIPNRVALALAGLFGVTGLVLAAVGLYGVLSYMVNRRRREIGIRIALGAGSREVRAMVLRDGLRLTGLGLLVGFVTAGLVTQLLRSLLFGLSPLDPLTYGTIAGLLIGVAMLACSLPARRAVRTEPLEVLRNV